MRIVKKMFIINKGIGEMENDKSILSNIAKFKLDKVLLEIGTTL